MTLSPKAPKPLSESEFLAFTAACDLQGGTAAEVQDRLVRQYDSDLSVKAVDVILTRGVQKGWLLALPSGNASPEPIFAPTMPYHDAVVLQFRRFLQQHALNRPEAIVSGGGKGGACPRARPGVCETTAWCLLGSPAWGPAARLLRPTRRISSRKQPAIVRVACLVVAEAISLPDSA